MLQPFDIAKVYSYEDLSCTDFRHHARWWARRLTEGEALHQLRPIDNVSSSGVRAPCEKGHRVLPRVIGKPNKERTITDPTMALMVYLRNVGLEPCRSSTRVRA